MAAVADCSAREVEAPSWAEIDDVPIFLSMHLVAPHCPPVPEDEKKKKTMMMNRLENSSIEVAERQHIEMNV